jgi:uncharacterized repeat protein (TIGR01451 family)
MSFATSDSGRTAPASASSSSLRLWRVVAIALTAATLLGSGMAMAICIPTVYNVPGTPPPTANWTDTTFWIPNGGFPGCAPGDAAQVVPSSPTTIVVNSFIPNPIIALNLNCNGCVIDIQSGGQLTIAGGASVGSGATLRVSGGSLVIANGGTLTFQTGSSFSFLGGQVDLQTGGTLKLTGTSTGTVASGGVLHMNGGTLDIQPSATLAFQNNSVLDVVSGSITGGGTLNNAGSFQINGASTIPVSVVVNNLTGGDGLYVNFGTLQLGGGGTGDAAFFVSSGATLDFPSGSYTLGANGVVSGDGTLSVSGATLSIGGVTSPGAFTMTAGTLTGAGFLTVLHTLQWDGGTITGSGGTQLAGNGSGNITGNSGIPFLDGRTFENYGSINYSANANPLHIQNSAIFSVFGTFSIVNDAAIIGQTNGELRVNPNGLMMKTGGSGTAAVSAFTRNNNNIYSFSGTLAFTGSGDHTGAFIAVGGGGIIRFGGGTHTLGSNSFIGGGGDIEINNASVSTDGTYDVDNLTTIDNGGFLYVMSGGTTHDLKLLSGSYLQVGDDFTLENAGVWSCGQMQVTGGAFIVGSGATFTIDSAISTPILNQGEILNNGTIVYNSTTNDFELQNDADIQNNGLFDIQTDKAIRVGVIIIGDGLKKRPAEVSSRPAALPRRQGKRVAPNYASGSPVVFNAGTLQKSAGGGTTDFQPDMDTTGTVKLLTGVLSFSNGFDQMAGTTTLGPGNMAVSGSPLMLTGGTIDGSGTITGDVDNDGGTIAPGGAGVGNLTFTGNYVQHAGVIVGGDARRRLTNTSGGGSSVDIGLASTASYDILAVNGSVTLDGILNVTLLGGFEPANADTFQPLTFTSKTGDFGTKNLPTWAAGHGTMTASYLPNALLLTAALAPLQADLQPAVNGPATVNAGAALSYTVAVTNNGPDPTSGTISVVDTLPTGVTGASGSGSGWSCGAPSGGTITCTTTSPVNPASSLPTLTFSMTAPVTPGGITNSATVSAVTSDPTPANNTASASTTVLAQADLQIVKNGPAGVTAGQNVVYTVVVTNNGPSSAVGVTVADPTPANLTFVSNSGTACTTPYPCNLGTLTSGQSATITSTYSTSPSFSGNVTNTATVSSSTADPNATNDSSTKVTNVGAQADLNVTKSGTTSVNPGQNVVYTIVVHNTGPSPAANTVVSDPTPPGIAFISNSGACTNPYPCNLGTLAAGQTVSITSTYTVPNNYANPTIVNTANVSSTVNDPDSTNDASTATTTVTVPPQADLAITKSGPASVNPGQNITYTIVVTNNGPQTANAPVVSDPTPAGLIFVSNSGACATPYPCSLASLPSGQTLTITSTYTVPINYAGGAISNTATVSSTTTDNTTGNNSSTATTNIATTSGADLAVAKSGPDKGGVNQIVDFEINVVNNGPGTASNVNVADPTPAGMTFVSSSGACPSGFPCTIASIGPGAIKAITARYRLAAASGTTVTNTVTVSSPAADANPSNNSASASVLVTAPTGCTNVPPSLVAPTNNSNNSSPVTLQWSAVEGAVSYTVTLAGAGAPSPITTNSTNTLVTLPSGSFSWTVQANFSTSCPPLTSAVGRFSVCNTPIAPLASVVGESTTGQTYNVFWAAIDGATSYELQEAGEPTFANPTTFTLGATSRAFTKTATSPTPFFYRVRAGSTCVPSPFSPTISVIVIPVPSPTDGRANVNVPAGSTTPVTFQVFLPGLPSGPTSFVATTDRPWAAVVPQAGIVPPEGTLLTVSLDPTTLVNGTWTGTILVVYQTPAGSGKLSANGSTSTSIPVSISLVTPVTPGKLPNPTASTQIIPTVGHLAGLDSHWQSDVRIANLTASKANYLVSFTTGSGDPTVPVKQTTLTVDPGATTALDDMIRNWFGVGSLGDSSNGVLFIQTVDAAGRVIPNHVTNYVGNDVSVNKTLAISSRTYNTTGKASTAGTLGQYVPSTAFANFIGKAGTAGVASLLSLQQIAQTDAYRTNLGLVEASGKPVTLTIGTFDAAGNKLLDFPLALAGGQQKQLNSFLAQNNVTLPNGRISVELSSGDGRVNAYASVVDAKSGNPFLVSGTPVGAVSSRYIVPAVGDLNTGNASWRSDLRIFNAGAAPQTATLTFYPNGNPAGSIAKTVAVSPGEVKALDNLLAATFGMTNVQGSLQVTTPTDSPLVVTSRTFNQTSNGTLGQFIPAVTVADSVGSTDRPLQILQAEESVQFRTNLGIAEVTGKPATVEISVFLPDSKVSPRVTIELAPNEARQLAILSSLGIGATYNARLAVRVVEGAGKVTAYGSVVDQTTQAPTFIPAQ